MRSRAGSAGGVAPLWFIELCSRELERFMRRRSIERWFMQASRWRAVGLIELGLFVLGFGP